jgi:hypothetical protein
MQGKRVTVFLGERDRWNHRPLHLAVLDPGTEIASAGTQVTLLDYGMSPTFTSTKTIPVTIPAVPGGIAYVNIHLDYGLKGTSGYSKDANNNAIDAATMSIVLIPDKQTYVFVDSRDRGARRRRRGARDQERHERDPRGRRGRQRRKRRRVEETRHAGERERDGRADAVGAGGCPASRIDRGAGTRQDDVAGGHRARRSARRDLGVTDRVSSSLCDVDG